MADDQVADDEIVVDQDPDWTTTRAALVVSRLPDVPPKAQSEGWGDMSWRRHGGHR